MPTKAQERYAKWMEEGRCGGCGHFKDTGKYRTCQECRDKGRKYKKKQWDKAKEIGLCPRCKSNIPVGTIICERCREVTWSNKKKWLERKKRERARG